MSRIRELARTPLVTIERFDHAPGDVPDDRREEEASGFEINVIEKGSFRLISGGRAWNVEPGATFSSAPRFVYRCEHADATLHMSAR